MEVSNKQEITEPQGAGARRSAHDKPDVGSSAILSAWRFVEDVAIQVDALRREVRRQVQAAVGIEKLGLRVGRPHSNYTDDKEEWVVRSVIDTFELYDRHKKGKPSPIIYVAFQISLAPSRAEADGSFYPNLAILVAGSTNDPDWIQWGCEDFELDNERMTGNELLDKNDILWKRVGERRWRAASADDLATAFVVSLVELKNEQDVTTRVIKPFVVEVESMLKRSLS
ncbi:MAG TPA: hypothetical protein VF292_01635 [Rhodanobacteraceae bacterium]